MLASLGITGTSPGKFKKRIHLLCGVISLDSISGGRFITVAVLVVSDG
jgi:hypothetical protein